MRVLAADSFVGRDTSLNAIPRNIVSDGDVCLVRIKNGDENYIPAVYYYELVVNDNNDENIPYVINPLANTEINVNTNELADDGSRWKLKNMYVGLLYLDELITSVISPSGNSPFSLTLDNTGLSVNNGQLFIDSGEVEPSLVVSNDTQIDNLNTEYFQGFVPDDFVYNHSYSVKIPNGVSTFRVYPPYPTYEPDYGVVLDISNVVDETPAIYSYAVTDKQADYFTVTMSGEVDSDNYNLHYFIMTNVVSESYAVALLDLENPIYTIQNENAYGSAADDKFGISVSISDDYTVVGASFEESPTEAFDGKVYVYDNDDGSLVHTITNPDVYSGLGDGDGFGQVVAVSDNYIAVTSPNEDDATGNSSGKVYIFTLSSGSLLQTIDNPSVFGTGGYDYFGEAMSLTDNYIAVGAWGEDDINGTDSGKVYIFDPSNGSLLQTLDNPNVHGSSDSDVFGKSIAINDNYVVVGVSNESSVDGNASGVAYLYDITDGSLIYTLENPNNTGTQENDKFGASVDISDSYVVVGACGEENESGRVYVFNPNTGDLLRTIDNPNKDGITDGDKFGVSVCISDNHVFVGAENETISGSTYTGKVYVFDLLSGVNVGIIENPSMEGDTAYDYFSVGMSATNNYFAVSAYGADTGTDTDTGKVYIYKL